MALSSEQITREIEERGFKAIDLSEYKNMQSNITVECGKGHHFQTNLASVRKISFECPCCSKIENFVIPKQVPPKTGYRLIAFDQATEHFGYSVWDDGKLVYYGMTVFSGDLVTRLTKIKKFVEDIVIMGWKPDFIVMEDIQQQHGAVLTYKILSMLLGVLNVVCNEHKIPFEVVSPNVWRKNIGTCGKDRKQEKLLSVAMVRQKYGITVVDDIAEAILIGVYGTKYHKKNVFTFGR